MKTNQKMQVLSCAMAIAVAFALAAAPISFAYAKAATRTNSNIGSSYNGNSSTDFLQTGGEKLGETVLGKVPNNNAVQGQGSG